MVPPDSDILVSPDGLATLEKERERVLKEALDRFYEHYGDEYERFGRQGRLACAEDLAFHLDFLQPALEFGYIAPFVAYLRWLAGVLRARDIPARHVAASLELIREAVSARFRETDAAALERAISQGTAALERQASGEPDPYACAERRSPEREAMVAALVRGDWLRAREVLSSTRAQAGLVRAYVNVLQPALYDVGTAWQKNELSVAGEHLATALAQGLMAEARREERFPPPEAGSVVLACAEGNRHAVGLRMVADAFELAGWSVYYLGADTPTRALVSMVQDLTPSLVGLSASLPQHLRKTREAIRQLRLTLLNECPPIMLGGFAVNQFAGIVPALGADFSSTDAARAAQDAATRVAKSH